MLTPNASCTLYLQTGPYRFRRIFCPAVFWQEDADGTSVIISEDLPEQYKGEKREHDFIVRGERLGEVTDTESKKAVSYTHLDVYKRQSGRNICRRWSS